MDKNGAPGFTKIPCSNLDQLDVRDYPKTIDSLITSKLTTEYERDSLVNYKIIGNVYYTLSLINCKIDSTSYNASVEASTTKKKEYWSFAFEEKDHTIRVISFFKRSKKGVQIPKQN